MSRDLNLLTPAFKADTEAVLELCDRQGFELRPYSTLRPPWDQAKFWRQSRTTDQIRMAIKRLHNGGAPWLASVLEDVGPQYGPHVTNALPGMSWHQWGEAVDCFVVSPSGSAIWDDQHPGYKAYAEAAQELGLTAGYYWTRPYDPVHIQARAGNIRDLYTLPDIDQMMQGRFAMTKAITVSVPSEEQSHCTEQSHCAEQNIVDNNEAGILDKNDVDILARTLFGEARGESDEGKTAVAWVVINRVEYALARGGYWWGNTIREVCLKKYQFSCWNSNDPNLAVIQSVDTDNATFRRCLEIARAVILGQADNPIGQATHYYANYIPAPEWSHQATLTATIGVHSFFADVR